MKKALLLSLTALFAGSTVTIQTKAMEVKEVITPADEELEIVPFEVPNTRKEVSITSLAKEYAFPVAAASIAVAIFCCRAFKYEDPKKNLVPPTIAREYLNKLSAKINDFYALSCAYKDPINDAVAAYLLLCVGKAAFAGSLTDMFNNASKNLPFGTGTFMKAKEPKEAK